MPVLAKAPENARPICLVTGGSSGLGRAIAEKLSIERGEAVCILSRQSRRLAGTVRTLAESDCEILSAAADVTQPADLRAVSSLLETQGYVVSTVFNVAGVSHFGPFDASTDADVTRVIGTNLIGPINVAREFLPHLRATSGQIVNVVSRCALRGIGDEAVYSAAKWGLRGFSEALREELKGTGVRVMAVYTSSMNTPFWDGWAEYCKPVDRSNFMEPAEVAAQVVAAAFAGQTCDVAELNISRRV
jgi:short-subunit dehydrogenase